jgi:hypothetical protein
MSEPKVVHEFRDYAYNGTMPFERRSMLIGVCDHIARLAARVQELESLEYRECRNAALEEAASVCDTGEHTEWDAACSRMAADIRALKEKQ